MYKNKIGTEERKKKIRRISSGEIISYVIQEYRIILLIRTKQKRNKRGKR